MNYEAARSFIRSGDIVAMTHRRVRSFYDLQVMAVRFFTASKYCHVGQAWHIGGRLFLLEAVTPKVRLVPLSNFAQEGFDWISIGVDMSDAEITHALGQVGNAGYSKWQAILAGLGRLEVGADALTECAEYVICNRRLSGVDLGTVAVPGDVVDRALELQGAQLRTVSASSSDPSTR